MGPKKIKSESPQARKGSALMKQMGLLHDDSDGDDDFEAELHKLTQVDRHAQKPKAAQKSPRALNLDAIEKLALGSTACIEDDDADGDDSGSGDEDDLMAELEELVTSGEEEEPGAGNPELTSAKPPAGSAVTASQLEERLKMYTTASLQTDGDDGRKRRLERGIKTLGELLKAVNVGKSIDESTIPPPVPVRVQPPKAIAVPVPAIATATTPATSVSESSHPAAASGSGMAAMAATEASHSLLLVRRDEYKRAAFDAKSSGNAELTKEHLVIAKKLDALISALGEGAHVDMLTIPPPPPAHSVPAAGSAAAGAAAGVATLEQPPPLPRSASPQRPSLPLSAAPGQLPPSIATRQPLVPLVPAATQAVLERQLQYKAAALKSKKAGDIESAKKYLSVAKGLDSMLAAIDQGKASADVVATLPPSPQLVIAEKANIEQTKAIAPCRDVDAHQGMSSKSAGQQGHAAGTDNNEEGNFLTSVAAPTRAEAAALFGAPSSAPKSVLEALEQRQEKYRTAEHEASTEGNNGKSRRMNRIVKQYEEAMKAYKSGKPAELAELPVPPGFGPLPTFGSGSDSACAIRSEEMPIAGQQITIKAAKGIMMTTPSDRPSPAEVATMVPPPPKPKRQASLSINEKQCQLLGQRQQEYRTAAMEAKRGGDLELAKNYLRLAKGLDSMIIASRSGLPVNMQSVPAPPPSAYSPEFVVADDDEVSDEQQTGSSVQQLAADREEAFKKLREALVQQITSCKTNGAHYRQLGDIVSASKFEVLEQNHRKDLDALNNALKHGDPVPKYHFETKTFPMIQCNTELGDNDLEIIIVRGIQYGAPEGLQEKDVSTYVTFSFPYPSPDEPQKHTTHVVKGSINPMYDETFKLAIDRKSHKFLRTVKAKAFKLEVFYKRGFLKEDRLLGAVSIKLETLEGKCTVHESLDLMDGRKAVGGKMELKMRLRKPLLHEQVEVISEKWLSIDQFVRKALPAAEKLAGGSSQKHASEQLAREAKAQSIEVLSFEKRTLDDQIRQLQSRLSADRLAVLKSTSLELVGAINQLTSELREGSLSKATYLTSIRTLPAVYLAEVRAAEQSGDKDKMKVNMMKIDLVKREIALYEAKVSGK